MLSWPFSPRLALVFDFATRGSDCLACALGDTKALNGYRAVDFTGQDMKQLPQDTPVSAQASIGDNGEIVENSVRYNPVTQGWRLMLRVKVKDPKKTTDMRAALVNADQTLSETWSYQLPANE